MLSEYIKHARHFDGLGMGDQDLERQAQALETENAILQADITTYVAANTQLVSENERLENCGFCAIDSLKAKNDALKAEVVRLRACLEGIADSPYCDYESNSGSPYGTGVVDGHRYCSRVASAALVDESEEGDD